MKTLTILIHGFNVWDGGRATVGNFRSFVAPYGPYIILNYGHFGLLESRFKNDKIAKRLHQCVKSGIQSNHRILVIGHSNGCAIIHRAARKYHTNIDRAVFINPALKKDIELASSISSVDVWHSPSDKPVKWSKYLPASNARPWGDMGARGYQGKDDPRINNFNKEFDFPVMSNSHSDVFKPEKITFFGPKIIDQAMRNAIIRKKV